MLTRKIKETDVKYDCLVFIGRFQPFHIGHLEVVINALSKAKTVVILIGSSGQPRTFTNPWTFNERAEMIYEAVRAVNPSYTNRISCQPLRDIPENDQKWASQVQSLVRDTLDMRSEGAMPVAPKTGIIGHSKDESSYYLKLFPQWGKPIEHALNEQVNATDIRALILDGKNIKFVSGVLPPYVFEMVSDFQCTQEFSVLQNEYATIKKYKKSWEVAPYKPVFVCTDACVIQSGHILLIKRAAAPGAGLMALIGGFLEQDEYIQDGMIRELREETKLKVPTPVLIGSIKEVKVFDRPDRSARGRTITHAFHIQLAAGPLPQVKGNKEEGDPQWIPLSEVREDQMFDDHFSIIQYFTGINSEQ